METIIKLLIIGLFIPNFQPLMDILYNLHERFQNRIKKQISNKTPGWVLIGVLLLHQIENLLFKVLTCSKCLTFWLSVSVMVYYNAPIFNGIILSMLLSLIALIIQNKLLNTKL